MKRATGRGMIGEMCEGEAYKYYAHNVYIYGQNIPSPMTLDKIIPNLFVSDYETVKDMSEEKRSQFFKISTLWPWEIGDPMGMEERYERYQNAPWQEPTCDANIVFSDPEAISPSYLDMEKLDAVALAIHHNIELGKKVLVFCKAGRERSPTAIIRYLHKYRGLSLHDAEELVRRQHEDTGNIGLWLKKLAD